MQQKSRLYSCFHNLILARFVAGRIYVLKLRLRFRSLGQKGVFLRVSMDCIKRCACEKKYLQILNFRKII